jgi:tRNA G26 N,N-dimethylase Trm1
MINFSLHSLITFVCSSLNSLLGVIQILILLNIFSFLLTIQALAASGLRSLRYAREIEGIGQVVAVDNDKGGYLYLSI